MSLPRGTSITGSVIINSSGDEQVFTGPRMEVINASQLVPKKYDWIDLSYSGDRIYNVVYRDGGRSGDIVAELDLIYSGDSSNILSVGRT